MTGQDMDGQQAIEQRLKQAGLRPTRQRLALAGLLGERARHVSAEALYAEAEAAGIKVSLATVYNTLHQFVAAGLLHEVIVEQGRSYFDTNVERHHHFFDGETGELLDVPDRALRIDRLPAPPEGMEIADVDVVIRLRRAR